MMNLNKRINQAAFTVTSEICSIVNDEKVKTDARRKMHMLDTWHRVMSRCISESHLQYEKCVFRTYYNSFTNRHTEEMTVDECVLFLSALCSNMKRVKEGDWNE